jgi:hypothetical protein
MRSNRFVRVLKIAAIAVVGIAVGGEVVTYLWNWLMPGLFGWHTISFWQSLGLLVLSRIFFGGFRGRPGFGRRRWEQMTPEQREQFKQGMRGGRCGKFEPPAPEPTAV